METYPKVKQHMLHQCNKNKDYELIQELHDNENWSISFMCKQLEIQRSSYYKWKRKPESKREIENNKLLGYIEEVVASNNSLFGSETMTMYINNKYKTKYNHKRIYRIMCNHDIVSAYRRKAKTNYVKNTPETIAANILNREFNATKPNEKWCTDVTEIKIPMSNEKIYMSPILDLYDRYPVGLVVSDRNDTFLATRVFEEALTSNPLAHPLYQSDRGFQYTRKAFSTLLESHGMTQSMSRVSRCIDNGPCESFQGFFKEILFILNPNISSKEEMIEAIYKTKDYYINEYPQKRFKGKTSGQVRREAFESQSPIQYPIKPNLKYINFWKHIKELQLQVST